LGLGFLARLGQVARRGGAEVVGLDQQCQHFGGVLVVVDDQDMGHQGIHTH
jgi:hypothetical protein